MDTQVNLNTILLAVIGILTGFLQVALVGLMGWLLLTVNALGKKVAALEVKICDLPCRSNGLKCGYAERKKS